MSALLYPPDRLHKPSTGSWRRSCRPVVDPERIECRILARRETRSRSLARAWPPVTKHSTVGLLPRIATAYHFGEPHRSRAHHSQTPLSLTSSKRGSEQNPSRISRRYRVLA